MKKSLFFGLVAILGLVGCSRNQEIDVPNANLSLFARTESPADTKTVVESGVHVYWEPGDEIAVFMGEKVAKFTTDITAASGTATFKGTFGDSEWPEDLDLWAVYPFSEDVAFEGETITTTLPSTQVAREGSFGKDMNLAIAHSSGTTLQFYNVGGGIRFSVTEEGIKKVMFEGLGGEIISGKVKIGMDENGKPEVKEVTGGSQFITLLPPSGQETFEPGAWYYIVAIPGSLEGGYKMRFYKDSDYARRVSEKAVTIKRSIYGNIEKADSEIEYEATTTHFPETEEEWEASLETTYQTGDQIQELLFSTDDPIQVIDDEIAEDIRKIDGVLDVWINPSKTGISVMQKDSIWINYYIDYIIPSQNRDKEIPSNLEQKPVSKVQADTEESLIVNGKKKALILAPFDHDFNEDLKSIRNCLVKSGFDSDNVKVLYDRQVSLGHFEGDYLSQFDFILITTHGGTGYRMYKERKTPHDSDYISGVSSLSTYIPYSKELAESFINNLGYKKEDIAISAMLNDNNEKEYYFAITPDFIKNASLNNSCVLLCACHSSELSQKDDPGSMVWRFLNFDAGIVTGNNNTTNSATDIPCTIKFLELASYGFSLQEAASIIQNSSNSHDFCNGQFDYWHNLKPKKYPESKRFAFQFYNLFQLFENPDNTSKPYYLVYHQPKLNDADASNSPVISFSWDCSLSPFETQWELRNGSVLTDSYSIRYDVYVDGNKIPDYAVDQENKKAEWAVSTLDKHSWYVVAKICLAGNDYPLTSFQSEIGDFTIKEKPTIQSVIYYTTSDGKVVNTWPFDWGVNIVSNEYKDGQGIITFDGELTELPYAAFHSGANLTSITLPESLKSLGELSFYQCTGLTSITIPDTVTTIGPQCFGRCTSLAAIHLPESLISLDYCCFEFCSGLTSITLPESLTSLGSQCFWACSNLTSITIPASVKSLGEYCFEHCTGLTKIIMKPTTPPIGGQEMFDTTNECPICVPAGCEEVYSTSDYWSQYAYRIVNEGGASVSKPDVVDLGLSVKWAKCNLGATYPGGYGNYFAWGEKEPNKTDFSWSTYSWCDGSENSMNKYYSGDGNNKLDSSDDVVHEQLGGNWRMPTESEWKELIDNCTWVSYTWDGVYGVLATSQVPGYTNASLFFPYSGKKDGCIKVKEDYTGYYWTSSLSPFYSMASIGMTSQDTGYLERYLGLPIRPVYAE